MMNLISQLMAIMSLLPLFTGITTILPNVTLNELLSTCEDNMHDFQICQKNCPQDCILCKGDSQLCQLCKQNYYLNSSLNNCLQCPEGCLECQGNGQYWQDQKICNQQGYYYIDQNQTLQACSDNCQKCVDNQTCQKCATGFNLNPDNKTCIKCPEFCQSCTQNGDCVECRGGYILQTNGTCSSCQNFINNCESCFYANKTQTLTSNLSIIGLEGFIQQITEFNYIIQCSQCQQGTILNPSLMECQSCGNCFCAFQDSLGSSIYPFFPPQLQPFQKQCLFCPDNQYLVDQTCYDCPSGCQNGCQGKNMCNFCQDGYGRDESVGCQSCPILTFVINCRSCIPSNNYPGVWNCVQCLPGSKLNFLGDCIQCQDPYCESTQNLRLLNNIKAKSQGSDPQYSSILRQSWGPCQRKNQFRFSQYQVALFSSFNIDTKMLIPNYIMIPYSPNGIQQCQQCPIGCLKCEFRPYKFYGHCMDFQCSVGFVFIDGRCLISRDQKGISSFQLSVQIDINCTESSLFDIVPSLQTSAIYQISRFVPLTSFLFKINVNDGMCLIHDTLKIMVEDEVIRKTFFNEFIFQGNDDNQKQSSILCQSQSYPSCIRLDGFNHVTINKTLLIYQIQSNRQIMVSGYFLLVNLNKLNLEQINVFDFKQQTQSNNRDDGLTGQLKGLVKLQILNSINIGSKITFNNITFQDVILQTFQFIDCGQTQFKTLSIKNMYLQNVTLINSIFLYFQAQSLSVQKQTYLENLFFNKTTMINSTVYMCLDQNQQISVQSLNFSETLFYGSGQGLFTSVPLNISNVIFKDSQIINTFLIKPLIQSQGNYFINNIVIQDCYLQTGTLLISYNNMNNEPQSSGLYLSSTNLTINNTNSADLSDKIASIQDIIQQYDLNQIQISKFQMIYNIINCQGCLIKIQDILIIESPSIFFGDIYNAQQVTISNISNVQAAQVSGKNEILQEDQTCTLNNSTNSLDQNYIQIQSNIVKLSNIQLNNLRIQKSVILLINVQTLQITQLKLFCNLMEPTEGQYNPTLVNVIGSLKSSINLINSTFEQNNIIFDNDIIYTQKDLSMVLNIFNSLSSVTFKNVLVKKNQQNVKGSKSASQSISSLVSVFFILSQQLIVNSCEFQGYYLVDDANKINTYIQQQTEIYNYNLMDQLKYLSSAFLYLQGQILVFIQNTTFSDNIAIDCGGIIIGATNLFIQSNSSIIMTQTQFRNMYCLENGCALTFTNSQSNLCLTVRNSTFSDILGLQFGIFKFYSPLNGILMIIEASHFKNCMSLQGGSIIDFWQLQGYRNKYLNNTYSNIDSTMLLFQQKMNFIGCTFSEDYNYGLTPAKPFTKQGQSIFNTLMRGSQIAIKITNCSFTNMILHKGLFQFSSSYVALLFSNLSSSLWSGTLIDLENCFVFIHKLNISDVTLCFKEHVCLNLIQKLLPNSRFQKQNQIVKGEINQDIQIQPSNEVQYYLQEQKLLVVQSVNYQLLNIFGYDIVIDESIMDQINCSDCLDPMIQIYYTRYNITNLNILNSFSQNAFLQFEEDLDNFKGGKIQNCKFLNNKALSTIKLIQASTTIDSCEFSHSITNQSQIYFTQHLQSMNVSTFLSITNSNFTFLQGILWSAAIAVDEMQLAKMNFVISNCSFINNTGKLAGSVISRSFIPYGDGNIFINNKAIQSFHNDILGPPQKLKFTYNQKVLNLSELFPDKIVSSLNNSLPQTLYVQLTQANDEVILFNELESFQFNQQLQVTFNNQINQITNNDNRAFIIDKLSIVSVPGVIAKLQISSQLLKSNNLYQVLLTARNCTQGEIYTPQDQVCTECKANTYTIDQTRCNECPYIAICPGGSQIYLKPNNWRDGYLSDQIVECSNYPTNCVGDIPVLITSRIMEQTIELNASSFNPNRYCSEGLVGPLCETCDITGDYWGTQYVTKVKYICAKCSNISNNIITSIVVIIWTVASIMISVYTLITDIEKDLQSEYLRKLGFLHGNIKDLSRQRSCLYKIIINHFQIFSIIFTFGIRVPLALDISVSSISNQLHHLSYSFDCLLTQNFNLQIIPIVYLKNLLAYSLPIFLFAFYILLFSLGVVMKKLRPRMYLIWTAFFFIILLFQPQVVKTNIETLACRQIAQQKYIQADVTQICYSDLHWFYALVLVLPGLVFYEIIVPGVIMYILYKNRNKLDSAKVKFTYGFIYYEYKRSAYYWELIKIFSRLLIFFSLSYFETDYMTKGATILALIQIYIVACQQVQPYLSQTLTKLDLYSSLINFTSILLTMILVQNQTLSLVVLYILFLSLLNVGWLILVIKDVAINYLRRDMNLMLKQIQSSLDNRQHRPRSNSIFQKSASKMGRMILAFSNLLGVNKQEKTLRLWGLVRKSFQEYLRNKEREQLNPNIYLVMAETSRRQSQEEIGLINPSFENVMKEQFRLYQSQTNISLEYFGIQTLSRTIIDQDKKKIIEPRNLSFKIDNNPSIILFPSPELQSDIQDENDPDHVIVDDDMLINTIRKLTYQRSQKDEQGQAEP